MDSQTFKTTYEVALPIIIDSNGRQTFDRQAASNKLTKVNPASYQQKYIRDIQISLTEKVRCMCLVFGGISKC
jgi:hypothetical protein